MSKEEEPSSEIQLLVDDVNEEELQLSSPEKENFSRFRALKYSSIDISVPAQSSKSKPLIPRVPSTLSENKDFKKYFEPRVVAIGPLHHRNPRLQGAEEAKLKLAVDFTKVHGVAEQVLYKKIKNEIGDLKNCYRPKDIEAYDDMELAWMFFVDGCAVLHTIHYCMQGKQKELNMKLDLHVFLHLDLFMLENQLPFRVLELLMSEVKENMRQSINEFIDDKIKTIAAGREQPAAVAWKKQPLRQEGENVADQEQPHLLGLLRERLLANHKPANYELETTLIRKPLLSRGRKRKKTFRSIKELKEAGIHVIPSETSSLLDVHFYAGLWGTLKIPCIVVDDSTASKFMNLVAYEMCPDFENAFEVTSYLCLLDSLIDTAEDVKALRDAGMLLNYMGSDEDVARLFNNLTTDLTPGVTIYYPITENIGKYCDRPCTKCIVKPIAKTYYTYFSTPWSVVGFLGALMGLIFTAIQTYYSMSRK